MNLGCVVLNCNIEPFYPPVICNFYNKWFAYYYGKSVSRNFRYMDPVFLDALASKFNVITFDYCGFGLSRGPRAADNTLSMAKDVKYFAEAFKLTKIIVAKWSISAMVAQTVTTQYPELVSHAILFRITSPGGMFYHY